MVKLLLRIVAGLAGLLGLALIAFLLIAPPYFDNKMNPVTPHEPYAISEEARALHATIPVADLHADTMLWNRNILERNDRGHVDLPRMREGGMFLQVFTAVTKTPRGLNYDENDTEAPDDITTLAMAQRWPRRTWDSRTERAVYQAEKLAAFAADQREETCTTIAAEEDDGSRGEEAAITVSTFDVVKSREHLWARLWQRSRQLGLPWDEQLVSAPSWLTEEMFVMGYPCEENSALVVAILGTEGSHALDGDLANVDRLFDVGYRVMGLQHFFDNALGGSLHGTSGAGLTPFGRDAVTRMRELGVIIDLAHSSEQVARDALAMGAGPFIVSHTGFNGHCQSPRNISDELMAAIAEDGGLIGVGFWADVTCGPTVADIADAIIYGAETFGVEHIALGSDFDGTVETPIDASEMAAITQALMDRGMPDEEIRMVMGGNTVRFFLENLPAD